MPTPAPTDPKPPWWLPLVPDVRGWATVAIFALAAYDLWLIANYPGLATNEIFKTATILLMGTGGLGLACSFLWGGSKASTAAADTVNAMAISAAGPPATSSTTTTTTTAGPHIPPVPPAEPVPVVIANTDATPVPVTETPPPTTEGTPP